MTSGIYAIKCDNSYYVGSSRNIEQRIKTHVHKLNKNKHISSKLQAIWNGEYSILILQKHEVSNFISGISLCQLEQSWVTYFIRNKYTILNKELNISTNPVPINCTLFESPELRYLIQLDKEWWS